MTSILPRGTTLALIVKDFEEHGHDEEKMEIKVRAHMEGWMVQDDL
ncbi:unnamed protein product [Penicillium camemberti]|uniref:Str. FM013 n=1 Tax=Penicillium camemberti (strain FM 013) TaxID=1429867 RepID=A0A0G4P1Y0_PENC3|nr:unnamed protein product [Penicillium camemberti]